MLSHSQSCSNFSAYRRSAKWLPACHTDIAVAVLTLEKTHSITAELNGRRSSFSAVRDTLHLQFLIDIHHITGVIYQKTKPFFTLHKHQQLAIVAMSECNLSKHPKRNQIGLEQAAKLVTCYI